MEESEQRRERLKAMRMEAAQGAETNTAAASYSLGNPLVEAAVPEPSIAPRFDFYTDPMSAFSDRTKVSHQTPRPPRPMNPHIVPGSYQTPGRFGRPMGPPSTPQQGYMNDAPGTYIEPGSYQTPGPFGRPMGPPSTPQQGNMKDAPGTYGFPSNMYRGGNFRGTGFVQRGGPHANYAAYGIGNNPQHGAGNWGEPFPHPGRGRTQWLGSTGPQTGAGPRGTPYHDSGRGRSQWQGGNSSQTGSGYHQSGRGRSIWRGYNSPGQRQSGRGSRDNGSAEFIPHLYYDKSMLEDPWKDLKPTLWRGPSSSTSTSWEDNPGASKPWLPKSISSKKARVSEEPVKYAAGKSLAEELAESFHAVKSNEANDDNTEDTS